MKLIKPKFWDKKKPTYLSYLLLPLTIPIIINNSPIRMRQTCCGSMICTKHAAGGRGPRWPILAVDGAENRSDTYSCRYM